LLPAEKVKIKVNQINEELDCAKSVEFTIFNTDPHQAATIFSIEAPNIDIESIKVSNLISPESKVFYL